MTLIQFAIITGRPADESRIKARANYLLVSYAQLLGARLTEQTNKKKKKPSSMIKANANPNETSRVDLGRSESLDRRAHHAANPHINCGR